MKSPFCSAERSGTGAVQPEPHGLPAVQRGDDPRLLRISILVIDEAARVPDELYRAVRPMMAVWQGRLICLSTPYGRRGFFHDCWANGGDDWARIEVPAERVGRITQAFLEQERRAHGRERGSGRNTSAPSSLSKAWSTRTSAAVWFPTSPAPGGEGLGVRGVRSFRRHRLQQLLALSFFARVLQLPAPWLHCNSSDSAALLDVNNNNSRYHLRVFHLDRRFVLRQRSRAYQNDENRRQ